jgi:putative redox protein
MMKQTGLYLGKNRVEMRHSDSNATILTDAPKDHDGLGESFAPTDLLAASVGSCVLTIMGIEATKRAWILEGASVVVEKTIAPEGPRRVSKIEVIIWLPEHLSVAQRCDLKRIAAHCPVTLSIQDSVEVVYTWLNA